MTDNAGAWKLGHVFVLRHAGMPFDWIEQLGDDAVLERAADRLLAAEAEVRAMLAGHRATRVRAVETALRTLGEPPAAQRDAAGRAGALGPALAAWSEAAGAYRQAYEEGYERLAARLHALAAEPRVREAVSVSNPDMYRNVWQRYTDRPAGPRNSARRRVDRQVYTYLQRLCGKNETTSFFGPIGYGTLDEGSAEACVLHRGGSTRRLVFFSHWAVTALAASLRRDRRLLPVLPLTVLDRDGLRALAAACEGSSGAGVPTALLRHSAPVPVGRIAGELGIPATAVVSALRPALRANTVELGPSYRSDRHDAFDCLHRAAAALAGDGDGDGDGEGDGAGDPHVLRRLGELDELARLRDDLAEAPFPERLESFRRLEEAFTRITGTPARRDGGIYTDRFVVYEEASSPFSVDLGATAAARLTAAVQEALDFSADYGALVRRGYQEQLLRRWPEEDVLSFPAYGEAMHPGTGLGSAFDPHPPLKAAPAALSDPQTRAAAVPRASAGPAYALPDVCLAASDVQAIAAGRFTVVVSRVHHHLLLESWLSVAHPEPARFAADAVAWVAEHGSATGLVGLDVSRRNKGYYLFPGDRMALRPLRADDVRGHRAEDGTDATGAPGAAEAAEAVTRPAVSPPSRADTYRVRRDDGRIVLEDAEGRERCLYLPLADLTVYPPLAALSAPQAVHARIEPDGTDRLPAVPLGGAVYQRQRWFVPMPDLGALTPAARHLELRRTAVGRGMPRFVYVRSDSRRKPYLLDTRSPFAAELLAHVTEAGERVQYEEMSPGPGELWLRDEEGRRYTCELRMQATRGAPPPAAGTGADAA
ncbi:hypothetical protein ACFW6F_02940 [Streptomyces sp. NPDC058746]|uniref:hypothetical protein n=1 Tax=Streptomyces sp. NPDC058746 TaxID=3346622 RepID=UPI0036A47F7D